MWMTEVLNGHKKIPGYFSDQRFLPFSKTSSPEVTIDSIRGIMANNHLTSIFENTILNKVKSSGSKLLDVPDYQSGFQSECSTQKNLSFVIHNILDNSRTPSRREILILFDFIKAFDSIKRSVLWEILRNKAKTKEEQHIVELII